MSIVKAILRTAILPLAMGLALVVLFLLALCGVAVAGGWSGNRNGPPHSGLKPVPPPPPPPPKKKSIG
jgi:hypothetical protein